MSHFPDRLFFRVALIGTLAAALGLAACGRKGSLDLPPSAASESEATTAKGKQEPGNAALIRSPFDKSGGNAPRPERHQVPDKPFLLDPLLN